jgi:hypothetical protein
MNKRIGRLIDHVTDADGMNIAVGVDDGDVTLSIGYPGDRFNVRLGKDAAGEFARLFVRACWEAAADA